MEQTDEPIFWLYLLAISRYPQKQEGHGELAGVAGQVANSARPDGARHGEASTGMARQARQGTNTTGQGTT